MSSITIAALRIYPKASLSPSERLVNCKKTTYKEVKSSILQKKIRCNISRQKVRYQISMPFLLSMSQTEYYELLA